MSRESATHANSGCDDKPQTTFVPFLPAPRGLCNRHSESPAAYLYRARVKSSCHCDCRTGAAEAPDNAEIPLEGLRWEWGQGNSVALALCVLFSWTTNWRIGDVKCEKQVRRLL